MSALTSITIAGLFCIAACTGCDSESQKSSSDHAGKLNNSHPGIEQTTATATPKVPRHTDATGKARAFVDRHKNDVDRMARLLAEIEPTAQNQTFILDVLSVFAENPENALKNFKIISEAVPQDLISVFVSECGRNAAKNPAPDTWVQLLATADMHNAYKTSFFSEMFEALPSAFNVSQWLKSTKAPDDLRFAAAATERSLKEAVQDVSKLDLIFDNVPKDYQASVAELLAGRAIDKVDAGALNMMIGMQNSAKEQCIFTASVHWAETDLNDALQWLDQASIDRTLKSRIVRAIMPQIANWDKAAAEIWRNKFSHD